MVTPFPWRRCQPAGIVQPPRHVCGLVLKARARGFPASDKASQQKEYKGLPRMYLCFQSSKVALIIFSGNRSKCYLVPELRFLPVSCGLGLKGKPVRIRNCSRNCKLRRADSGGMSAKLQYHWPFVRHAPPAGRFITGRESGDLPHSNKQ